MIVSAKATQSVMLEADAPEAGVGSGERRRRSWSVDKKRRIVGETTFAGCIGLQGGTAAWSQRERC